MIFLGVALAFGAAAPTAHAAKPNDELQAAREHYKRGTTLYDLGKYDEAIAEFEQAYEIKDDPVLLYNIAQSYRLSNRYAEALRFYRNYLRKWQVLHRDAPNRDEVEQKIADMEQLIAAQNRVQSAPPAEAIPPRGDRPQPGSVGQSPRQEPTHRQETAHAEPTHREEPTHAQPTHREEPTHAEPTHQEPAHQEPAQEHQEPAQEHAEPATPSEAKPAEQKPAEQAATPPPSSESKPGRGKLIGGIVIAVAGVALVGAGLGLGFAASGMARQQESATTFDPGLQSTGKSLGIVGVVCDAVGGVAIVAGAVVAAMGATAKPERQAMIVPAVGPGYAGATAAFHF